MRHLEQKLKLNARLTRSRHGVYYFRYIVPIQLQNMIGRREIKRSLNTKDPKEAHSLAHLIALRLSTGIKDTNNLPILTLSKLSSKSDWESFMHRFNISTWVVRDQANKIVYEADPNKPGDSEALERVLVNMYGKNIRHTFVGQPIDHESINISQKFDEPLIADLLFGWKSRISTNVSTKTVDEYTSKFDVFNKYIGLDKSVSAITNQVIFNFVNDLKSGKATGKCLSINTVNKYIAAISSFLNCAKLQGAIPSEKALPTYGQKLKIKNKSDESSYEIFTDDEIKKIFNPENFANPKFLAATTFKPHMLWLPLIGIYTGARIEEICQLELTDIRSEQINGANIWVIDINDDDLKKLKTASSKRVVPLHSALIDLGLLKYIEDLKSNFPDEKLIFPYLSKNKYGKLSDGPSKWFGRYLTKIGISEKGKVFHSFRGTANNKLKQEGVTEEARCQMIGHVHDTINSSKYSEKFDVLWLFQNVTNKINFPINIEKLKNCHSYHSSSIRNLINKRNKMDQHQIAKVKNR